MSDPTTTVLQLAAEANKLGHLLNSQQPSSSDDRAPSLRENSLPEISLLSLKSPVGSRSHDYAAKDVLRNLDRLDPDIVARLELEIQPEQIFKEHLSLRDMQPFDAHVSETPLQMPEWELPSLDFEMVLERDPFSTALGVWREADTSGFEMNCQNSADFRRAPGDAGEESLLGTITQMPFAPGGMEDTFVDRTKFLQLSPAEIEEGRDWVLNMRNLPVLPPEFASSDNEEFILNDQQNSDFTDGVVINGLHDVLDDRELTLIKTLRSAVKPAPTDRAMHSQFQSDMKLLLDMAGYGDIYRELNPEQHLDGKLGDTSFLKISSAPDSKNTKEWAVKVDLAAPVHDFATRMPNMAHKYPFELDVFQKQAVLHLENHESVFVAAHTSAGKTVVAEYAIALSLRAKSRVVYTSPIKALSNQKYRDFKTTFGDVGLLTGDVQIEPRSHCLVMTTEILRSMLYRGSEIVRDLDWVIFDEVHYINDSERGVVWEEILIMLPAQVGIVMLSATVPNAMEFADWIGRIKQRKIYVISTLKRPVPLEHHLFVCTGSKTIDKDLVIVNTKGEMLTKNHAAAVEIQREYERKNNIKMGLNNTDRIPPKQDRTVWLAFMDFIEKADLKPVIAFVFSRNRCDQLGEMVSALDLTSKDEKHKITTFFRKAVSRLNGTDRELPQILKLEYYLERGVGVHHSGILPIMKEAVEMLFAQGLVKILFATETFAMGVNMPARTVVFDTIRKHDGTEFRDLRPGEYIQMSGRAGRRGLDKTGTVFILCKLARIPDSSKLNQIILGVPTKLQSQFRLTYGMILQLFRIGTISIMDMMKRSFVEHGNASQNPKHQEDLAKLLTAEPEDDPLKCDLCKRDIEDYCRSYQACRALRESLNVTMLSPSSRLLAPGRVVTTNTAVDQPLYYGVILSAPDRLPQQERYFRVLELVRISPDVAGDVRRLVCKEINKVLIATVKAETERILSEGETAKTSSKARKSFQESIEKVAAQLLTLKKTDELSPAKDFKMTDMDFVEKWEELQAMESTLPSYDCTECPQFYEHVKIVKDRLVTLDEISRLRYMLSNESLRFLPEYQQRVQVLKGMGYVTADDIVTLRGRVACEVSTTEHDLLMAECVFANVFTDREPEEIVALLSGLVFQAKTDQEMQLPPQLLDGIEAMRNLAQDIGNRQRDAGMKQATSQMADSLNFGLVEVVYHWCRGMPFVDITSMTDVQEGIIVRTMTRLDEVCRDVRGAAKVTGNSRLIAKMEAASRALKRDIAFVGSLYTSD